MNIGENIKKYRKIRGLTQKELAELCGLATGTIQQYELGKRTPNINTIIEISKKLEVTVDNLMSQLEFMSPQELHDYIESDTDTEFTNAWDNFLIINNIHFMSFEKKGIHGMLLTFTDTNESYFLTKEQAEQLPELSIEQIKILIKAMGKENTD